MSEPVETEVSKALSSSAGMRAGERFARKCICFKIKNSFWKVHLKSLATSPLDTYQSLVGSLGIGGAPLERGDASTVACRLAASCEDARAVTRENRDHHAQKKRNIDSCPFAVCFICLIESLTRDSV